MTKYRTIDCIILLVALVTGIGIREAAAVTSVAYTVTDLGSPDFTGNSEGHGINASGQVTGYDPVQPSFLWTPTTPNSPDGTLVPLYVGYALDINASGQVIGQGGGSGSFLWTPTMPNGASGTLADLGSLGGTGLALGINDSGQVTGQSGTSGNAAYRPYLWTPTTSNGAVGTMIDLGTLGGTLGSGSDINNSGQVTGQSSLTGNVEFRAILWSPTMPNGASGTLHDLGTLGGTLSEGISINAVGQVTGRSYTTGDSASHAILWTPTTPNGASGTMIDIGTLPGGTYSLGWDINTGGQVTGVSNTGTGEHAFLYTIGSGMVDLNTLIDPLSGWVLRTGYGINDAGQITGYGAIGGHQNRAFLLTPVPEPASVALLALGLPLLVWRNSRRSGTGGIRAGCRFVLTATGRSARSARSNQ